MSRPQETDRHIIWSNVNLDLDDIAKVYGFHIPKLRTHDRAR